MKPLVASTRVRIRAVVARWLRATTRTTTAIAVVVSACVLGTAAAQLDVEAAGGPLTLPEEVGAAFAAWQDAFPDGLSEPTASIAFAPELLGPDTASLTLRWEDGRTDVLLAPARYRAGPVLVHEIGVLLGLAEIGPGVMDPVLTAESPDGPTAEDISLLQDLFTYPPADLTRDGTVDFYDLAAFSAAYGSVGINLRADLTGDGRVDDADLAAIREAYTFAPPSAASPSPANLAPQDAPTQPATGIGDEPTAGEAGEADGGEAEQPGAVDPPDGDDQDQLPSPPDDESGGDTGEVDTGDTGADDPGDDPRGDDPSGDDPGDDASP